MAARTSVPRRQRILGWAAHHIPAVARALRGTQAAGTTVDRRSAAPDGPPLDLDIWLPPGHDREKTGAPVVVVLPRIRGDWLPSTLAKDLRAVVINMPVDDDDLALAGLRWISAHTPGWNGTPERLGIVGDGPGADRALRVAALARDTGGPSILRLVLVSPSGAIPAAERSDTEQPGRGLGGLPSTLVHTGSVDPRRPQVIDAVAALRGSDVTARLVTLPSADQGWLAQPAADPALARRSLDEIVAFLRRGLTEERAFGVGPA